MFDHSIKVPRLYKVASKVAKQVSESKGSIKQLVYECKHPVSFENIKGLYALVVHAFQRTEDIEKLLKKSKLLIREPRFDPWLAKILITELLWGKNRLTGESKPIKTILGYEQIFKAHMSDLSPNLVDLQQVEKPRYVRINTLKITVNEAIEGFRDEGWILKRYTDTNNYLGFLDAVANLGPEEFMASCLPVHILNAERGATILDMCAAPGMKTTQTAAVLGNEGLIYAVEIGTKRFNTLTKIIESSGATCVKTINRDVTTLTDKDCPGVEYILVDPSCSGSGITDRVEIGQQERDQHNSRLEKLAAFQITMLRYALTKFPKAKKVVYSTCSIYPEENEDVVRQVLETCTKFKLIPANQFVKNSWLNFGSSEFGDIGNYCLYAKPDIDLTSGFFVAVFERLEKGESNPFLNFQLFPVQRHTGKKRQISQDYLNISQDKKEDIQNEGGEYSNKKRKMNEVTEVETNASETQSIVHPKKKKKKRSVNRVSDDEDLKETKNAIKILVKKENTSKKEKTEDSNENVEFADESTVQKKKKKKHH
ncbi:methyltransferase NSUN5, partial [Asbolus verrucosus]